MINRTWLLLAAIGGFSSVALGAFAAHGLKNVLAPSLLNTFQTGVHYQMAHSLTLLALAILAPQLGKMADWAGRCFVIGMVLFSGSLYALSLANLPALGMVTPLGGLAFLAGWACLGMAAWRTSPPNA